MPLNPEIERVLQVKRYYEQALLAYPNVVGVGVGFKTVAGAPTDTLALIVNVVKKQSTTILTLQEMIPTELDGVPVDVQEVGAIRAL